MSDAQPIRRKGIQLGRRLQADGSDQYGDEIPVINENFPVFRTIHLLPKEQLERPASDNRIDIVVTQEVLLATFRHVSQNLEHESGGFLLGNRYLCPNTRREYIVIDQFMKADYTEGTQVSLTFTTDSWAQLKDRLDGKYRGKALVGWYHSHPSMGIFLSNYDVDIHRNRFANEWDVALVLDPVKHEGGFFAWADGNVNPREQVDFYELLDDDKRETVIAWTNYYAQDPKIGALAALKSVNTKTPGDDSETKPKAAGQVAPASGGFPLLLLAGAGLAVLLFIGTALGLLYWWSRPSDSTADANTNGNVEPQPAMLKSGDISATSTLPKGSVTDSGKIFLTLTIKGIGSNEVIEEVRKEGNVEVEVDGQKANITGNEIGKNNTLILQTQSDLSPEKFEDFKNNKPQKLPVRIELRYAENDSAAKLILFDFNKGKGKTDLGMAINFSGADEKEDKTRKITKPPTNEVQSERDDKSQTQPVTQPVKNNRTSQTKDGKKDQQGDGAAITRPDVENPKPTPKPNQTRERSVPTPKPTAVGRGN